MRDQEVPTAYRLRGAVAHFCCHGIALSGMVRVKTGYLVPPAYLTETAYLVPDPEEILYLLTSSHPCCGSHGSDRLKDHPPWVYNPARM